MKLNKTMGRVATTLVATAMLASVAVVPAFADEVPAFSDGVVANQTDLTSVKFTKTYRMPANVTMPTATFTFTVAGADPAGEKLENEENVEVPVKTGELASSFSVSAISKDDFGDAVYSNENTIATYTAPVTFTLPDADNFSEPGVYKYTVTESVSGSTTDIQVSDPHTLYVYVENNPTNSNEKVITGVVFEKASGDKTDDWVNYYKLSTDPDEDDPQTPPTVKANELTIENRVTGDMANMSKQFSYAVTVNAVQPVTAYIETKQSDGSWKADEAPTSLASAVTLLNNQRLHIYGLSENDTVTVDQNDYSNEGYTVSVTKDDSAYTDDTPVTFGTTNVEMVYTNSRAAVSPTGIVMNVAPYALLVVVAAAGCFVFMRKRRED